MTLTPYNLLVVIALIFSVVSFLKPAWQLLPVAVLLVCIALLIGKT
jgi:hypothetical protein